jgi:hypothetical protein
MDVYVQHAVNRTISDTPKLIENFGKKKSCPVKLLLYENPAAIETWIDTYIKLGRTKSTLHIPAYRYESSEVHSTARRNGLRKHLPTKWYHKVPPLDPSYS